MKHELPPLPEPWEIWEDDGYIGRIQGHADEAMTAYGEQVAEPLLARIAELEAQITQLTASLETASSAVIMLKQQQREGWAAARKPPTRRFRA
jgi:phage shock protein A